MGLFDQFKDAQRAAEAAPGAQQAAEAQAQALQAGLTPDSYDPNDPGFVPVEGITLEEYARLTKLIVQQSLQTEEEVDAFMQTQGVPAGRWKAISDEWNNRMKTNRAVINRYGILYAQSG